MGFGPNALVAVAWRRAGGRTLARCLERFPFVVPCMAPVFVAVPLWETLLDRARPGANSFAEPRPGEAAHVVGRGVHGALLFVPVLVCPRVSGSVSKLAVSGERRRRDLGSVNLLANLGGNTGFCLCWPAVEGQS